MNRGFLLILISFTALFSCENNAVSTFKNYGPTQVDSTKAITLDDMLLQLEQNPEKTEFTFFAPVNEVCQAAGCWVTVTKPDGNSLRVRFKNHFLIPTKTKSGVMAYYHGSAYWDTVSVAMQKHFAEDNQESQAAIDTIKTDKFELCFEADGILIEKPISASKK